MRRGRRRRVAVKEGGIGWVIAVHAPGSATVSTFRVDSVAAALRITGE